MFYQQIHAHILALKFYSIWAGRNPLSFLSSLSSLMRFSRSRTSTSGWAFPQHLSLWPVFQSDLISLASLNKSQAFLKFPVIFSSFFRLSLDPASETTNSWRQNWSSALVSVLCTSLILRIGSQKSWQPLAIQFASSVWYNCSELSDSLLLPAAFHLLFLYSQSFMFWVKAPERDITAQLSVCNQVYAPFFLWDFQHTSWLLSSSLSADVVGLLFVFLFSLKIKKKKTRLER